MKSDVVKLTSCIQNDRDVWRNREARTRIKRYTPAVTIVAAWIKAETGVGPSIAIGNHICNPTCELLAIAPINKQIPTSVTILSLKIGRAHV